MLKLCCIFLLVSCISVAFCRDVYDAQHVITVIPTPLLTFQSIPNPTLRPWPLNDLQGQRKPAYQIFRSKVISFEIYSPDTHTHPRVSAPPGPLMVGNDFMTADFVVAVAEMAGELQKWTKCRLNTLQPVSVNAAECYNLTELWQWLIVSCNKYVHIPCLLFSATI